MSGKIKHMDDAIPDDLASLGGADFKLGHYPSAGSSFCGRAGFGARSSGLYGIASCPYSDNLPNHVE
jgi:hypothetical protein